jgi:hypothetical protein
MFSVRKTQSSNLTQTDKLKLRTIRVVTFKKYFKIPLLLKDGVLIMRSTSAKFACDTYLETNSFFYQAVSITFALTVSEIK